MTLQQKQTRIESRLYKQMTLHIGNETHWIDVFGGSVSEDKHSRLLSKEKRIVWADAAWVFLLV